MFDFHKTNVNVIFSPFVVHYIFYIFCELKDRNVRNYNKRIYVLHTIIIIIIIKTIYRLYYNISRWTKIDIIVLNDRVYILDSRAAW